MTLGYMKALQQRVLKYLWGIAVSLLLTSHLMEGSLLLVNVADM